MDFDNGVISREFFESVRKSIEVVPVVREQETQKPKSLASGGTFDVLEFDLSSASPVSTGPGYFMQILQEGTVPGTRLSIASAGRWQHLVPGEYIKGRFDNLIIERSTRSVIVGTARVLIIREPGVEVGLMPASGEAGKIGEGVVGPAAAATQTHNHASSNRPSGATDGVSLVGCTGFRVMISAATAFDGTGTVRLWQGEFLDGSTTISWFRSAISYDMTDANGYTKFMFPNEIVSVAEGRVYAEALSVANSGAGAITVRIQTWG